MSQLSGSTTQISDTYNILTPNKRLEQLIAKSWLDGKRLSINQEFLVQNNILSPEEGQIFKDIVVVEKSNLGLEIGFIDTVNMTIRIPYPEQAPLSEDVLKKWVNSDPLSPPWSLLRLIGNIREQENNLPKPRGLEVVSQPFNIIRPNKKLSQLIAQSWLDHQELNIDRLSLIQNSLLSEFEAQFVTKVKVDEDPEGPPYLGGITVGKDGYRIFIPYPKQRPDVVTDDELTTWVNSTVGSEPYTPFGISQWIPYSC